MARPAQMHSALSQHALEIERSRRLAEQHAGQNLPPSVSRCIYIYIYTHIYIYTTTQHCRSRKRALEPKLEDLSPLPTCLSGDAKQPKSREHSRRSRLFQHLQKLYLRSWARNLAVSIDSGLFLVGVLIRRSLLLWDL